MLVLTRKTRQSIMIGDDIEISVLSVSGDKVRIGIEAPRSVPVFRTEVYIEMKSRSGEAAAEGARQEVEHALSDLQSSGRQKPPE